MECQADQTVEIKARCADPGRIRKLLQSWGASFKGTVTQTDTFYNAAFGRLKLRESESRNLLIGYRRPDIRGPKHCLVDLYESIDSQALGKVLAESLGIRAVVKKRREIYTMNNVKFHLDQVEPPLGSFVEIEVLGHRGTVSVEDLRSVCEKYLVKLGIKDDDLVEEAYVDLLEKASSG
ncbi:MAG TPA: class IV adenylate cyclase [archaeon]|nr:class IV adenylate cyclase [archaeon]